MGAILLVMFQATTFAIVLPSMDVCEEVKKANRQWHAERKTVVVQRCMKTRDA